MIYHTEESLPAPLLPKVCVPREISLYMHLSTFFGKKDAMMMQGKRKVLLQAYQSPNVKEISILSAISSCAPARAFFLVSFVDCFSSSKHHFHQRTPYRIL